jgi:hypothetical protein
MGVVLGYPNLEYIFSEEHYKDLAGGILESFATLFSRKVKLIYIPNFARWGDLELPAFLSAATS